MRQASMYRMEKIISAALCRAARAMAGIDQDAMASACGVSRPTIQRAERDGPGPRAWPRIIAGAAALGVVIDADARSLRLASELSSNP